ncbi:hypothetical protein HG15A2_09140 [Adhaeretor mobilis]|uniref:Uncharacterized protein n=1 Tax=Adhaeretor mobilis TaxID=1930276 RepID=A0A517MRZ6_9BACT|nr:hypothetical protein HG15A2_09140 [Adhaeretor mobilis]
MRFLLRGALVGSWDPFRGQSGNQNLTLGSEWAVGSEQWLGGVLSIKLRILLLDPRL